MGTYESIAEDRYVEQRAAMKNRILHDFVVLLLKIEALPKVHGQKLLDNLRIYYRFTP